MNGFKENIIIKSMLLSLTQNNKTETLLLIQYFLNDNFCENFQWQSQNIQTHLNVTKIGLVLDNICLAIKLHKEKIDCQTILDRYNYYSLLAIVKPSVPQRSSLNLSSKMRYLTTARIHLRKSSKDDLTAQVNTNRSFALPPPSTRFSLFRFNKHIIKRFMISCYFQNLSYSI